MAKPAAKAPAKKATAKTAVKTPAKKAPAKTAPVKAAKPAAKKPVATPKAKPAAKPAAKAAAKPKAVPAKTGAKANGSAGPALPRAMPPRPDAATLGAEPARATKPSARLAQITVPSMAQSVASTAAKASYTQTMSPSVLTPPPLVAIKKDPKLANNWKSKEVAELTDAEVLAMPDSEYMNEKQMAFFRLKLAQLKQDILNSAGETTEHLREDTVIVPDPADRATIEEEHALELRTRDRERKLLKKIEQSIARIDAGDYGYCDETGEPIGVGRLLARPTATLSLEAQQRRELKQKMFGD
ncbi:RNA polymerase-binding protein DksA [Caenimonas sp. S4]|nr:RNA polymerase-binding protein DksA [Caenimonas soli]